MRVLKWIVDRCQGRALNHECKIGHIPLMSEFDFEGLKNFTPQDFEAAMCIDPVEWKKKSNHKKSFSKALIATYLRNWLRKRTSILFKK